MYMKSWLHSLVRSTPWQRSRKSPARRLSMQQVASHIEHLEDRTLLSISATFDTTTMQLKVTSDASDPIIVTTNGPFVKVNGVDPLRGPTLGTTTFANSVASILIEGGPGANNINLGAVTTAQFSGLNNQITIMGGDGADTIVGTGFRDSIEGNEASDLITGGSVGPDTISGGDGADTITGTNGGDSLTGDSGRDIINGLGGDDTIIAGGGADSVNGGAGKDSINGGGGSDTLIGGLGSDRVAGRGGDDLIIGGVGQDLDDQDGDGQFADDLDGDGDIDAIDILNDIDVDTLVDDGNDTLFGNNGNDALHGGTGDDFLSGGGSNDTLFGHDGDDTLLGNRGADSVHGGRDNDSLVGGPGNDTLLGGEGSDTAKGQKGNDSINGGPGLDTILGGAGNDILEAGVLIQFVFLDFVTGFNPGDHLFLDEDLNDNGILEFGEDTNGNGVLDDDPTFIQQLLEADFANYDVIFTRTQPTSGDFVTIVFNEPPNLGLGEVPFLNAGEASEIDFRNTRRTGRASVDVTDLLTTGTNPVVLPGDPADVVRQKFNAASAFVAAHELGHLMGLRNADAIGPLGINPNTGQPYGISEFPGLDSRIDLTNGDFRPKFPGPKDAFETNLHIMGSLTMISQTEDINGNGMLDPSEDVNGNGILDPGEDLNGNGILDPAEDLNGNGVIDTILDVIGDPFLSERSAIKLAFADTGLLVREQRSDNVTMVPLKSFDAPQPITLRRLITPNSLQSGQNAAFELDVEAAVVWDARLSQSDVFDDNDFYSFTGSAGELVNIEVNSYLLDRMRDDPLSVRGLDERVNTMIRVFDTAGRPVPYFTNRTPGIAFDSNGNRLDTGPFTGGNARAQFIDSLRTDSAVSDDFDDSGNVVPGVGSFDGANEDPILINLTLPTNGTYIIMVSEPFERGVFGLPIDDQLPGTGIERSDIVELDPVTGVELNRFPAPVATDVPTAMPPLRGGASLALDASGANPDSHVLYFMNPSRTTAGLGTNQTLLFHLDPDDGTVLNQVTVTLPVGFIATDLDGMALLPSGLYLLDVARDDIIRINPATGATITSFDIDNLDSLSTPFANLRNNAERQTFFNNVTNSSFLTGTVGGVFRNGTELQLDDQSGEAVYFQRTSEGNPDDIDARFNFRIQTPGGAAAPDTPGEGFAFGLLETQTYGITGLPLSPNLPNDFLPLPGGFGADNSGIDIPFGSVPNSLIVVFDTRDNDGAMGDSTMGDPNANHFTVYLDGIPLVVPDPAFPMGTINVTAPSNLDNNAFHTARIELIARDSTGQPTPAAMGFGLATGFGSDLLVTVDNLTIAYFLPGPVGREYLGAIGESRVAFWRNSDFVDPAGGGNIDAFQDVFISNLAVDFAVPYVRDITRGLAGVSRIPTTFGAADTTLDRLLILDVDEQNRQIVHEINPLTGQATSSFRPLTSQGTNNQYEAIGAVHLHNSGFDQPTMNRVGTQVLLGTGDNTNQFLVHAFNREGTGGQSGFTAVLPQNGVTSNFNPSITFDTRTHVNPVTLQTDPQGDPAFRTSPGGAPQYNLTAFGADDNVRNRTNLGNFGEDLNENGVLDPGEDQGNRMLDPGEDLNGNGVLDPGEDLGNGIIDLNPSGNYELLIYKFDVNTDPINNPILGGGESLNGGSGNDNITGGSANDTIIGGNGNDLLQGGSGRDIINGGRGFDTLRGGNGADTLRGGRDDDTLLGEDGNDDLDGEAGRDSVDGGRGGNLIRWNIATDGMDVIDGTLGGFDTLLVVTAGEDDMITIGSSGTLLTVSHDSVSTAAVTLTVKSVEHLKIQSGGGEDTIIINDLSNVPNFFFLEVEAGDQNDKIDASAQADTSLLVSLSGGKGDDTIIGGSSRDSINGNAGNDLLMGGLGGDVLRGNGGADTLQGGRGDDALIGNSGDDVLDGQSGNDTLDGGAQNDVLFGGSGRDFINGRSGFDLVFGGAGNDVILGGNENPLNSMRGDTLHGGDGADLINGENGDDQLFGDGGADTLLGGQHADTLSGGDGNDDLSGGDGDTSPGTDGNDLLNGDAGNDTLRGEDGDDTLLGGADDDDLEGNLGNDLLDGQGGHDSIRGGDGQDLLIGGDGNDSLNGGGSGDTLEGGSGNDALAGHDGRDLIRGGDGADTLVGGVSNDTLRGGNGNDVLVGGEGADNLDGQANIDTLSGGDGLDVINDNGLQDPIDESLDALFMLGTGISWIDNF